MFLRAGALSLALLLASRLLGLARESAQAAAFGASGLADIAVLMLTLPDWFAGIVASGALAYVLVPAWAGQAPGAVAASQRRLTRILLATGAVLAAVTLMVRLPLAGLFAAGAEPSAAAAALAWSALALPGALLAALWGTRLQHESDFAGLYASNLVVNGVLVLAIATAGLYAEGAIAVLGAGLLLAMALRLAWMAWRTPRPAAPHPAAPSLPGAAAWGWAALSAGLPLALPFVARSIASPSGEGALAVFNYAWKLVELPLVLAIQLVATIAFPAIAKSLAARDTAPARHAVRRAFALAWTLACASAAGLLLAAPAVAKLLFGWGRMDAAALADVAAWGRVAAWSLPPQAVIAVALTVLAARSRLRHAVFAYALALAALLVAGALGLHDGAWLMALLDVLFAGVAAVLLVALGREARSWLPLRDMAAPFVVLVAAGAASRLPHADPWLGLAAGVAAALLAVGAGWWRSEALRAALAR